MSVEYSPVNVPFTAGEDLSSDQYKFVKFTAEESVVKASASTDDIVGVLQNEPSSGEEASVAIAGISKVVAGGSISHSDYLIVDESDNGKAVAVSSLVDTTDPASRTKVAGMCVDGCSDGEVGSIDLNKSSLG